MNKLFTRIGVAFVGIAMAVGAGVAVSKHTDVKTDAAISVETTPINALPSTVGTRVSYVSTFIASSKEYTFNLSNSGTVLSQGSQLGETSLDDIPESSRLGLTKVSGSNYALSFVYDSSTYYVGYDTSTKLKYSTSAPTSSDTEYLWTGNYNSTNKGFVFTNVSSTNRILKWNGSTDLRPYISSNGTTAYIRFYPYTETVVTVTGVSITGTVNVTSGVKELASTQLTATVTYAEKENDSKVIWDSSNKAVAVVNQAGLVTFLSNGNSTISAVSKEDGSKSASVTVSASNLEDVKGTAERPFSPAEVRLYVDGAAYDSNTTKYVHGIVSKKDEWSEQYTNGNFYLTDNGNDDSPNRVEIFRYKNESNFNTLVIGDYVLVSGKWTKYQSTYETTEASSAFETSSIKKVSSIEAISASDEYPVNTILDKTDFQVDATYANGYVAEDVSGYTFTVNGNEGAALVEGSNTIAFSYLGASDSLAITGVATHITEILIDATATVQETHTVTLTIVTDPESGYSDIIVWKSADNAKATVNQSGVVTGVTAGTVVITVFADKDGDSVLDQGEVSASCTVTVTEREVSSVSIVGKKTSFTAGDAFTLGGDAVIAVTFTDEGTTTISEDNPNLVYYIGTQEAVNNKTADTIEIGDTLISSQNGLYVKAYYKGVGASAYTIKVATPFDYSQGTFYKVTSEPLDWTGKYILVYEAGEVAFHGADVAKASTPIEIDASNRILPVNNLAVLDIAAMEGGYSIKVRNGTMIDKYLGATSDANGLAANADPVANTISLDASGNVDISSSNAHIRFNSAAEQARFRFFKSSSYNSQQMIQIYKYRPNSEVVQEFVDTYMHMDYDAGGEKGKQGEGTGLCTTYYPDAKAAFNGLTDAQRTMFCDPDGDYKEAFERLKEWARIVGDDFNDSTKILESTRVGIQGFNNKESSPALMIIIAISSITLVAIAGCVILKRKER